MQCNEKEKNRVVFEKFMELLSDHYHTQLVPQTVKFSILSVKIWIWCLFLKFLHPKKTGTWRKHFNKIHTHTDKRKKKYEIENHIIRCIQWVTVNLCTKFHTFSKTRRESILCERTQFWVDTDFQFHLYG